MKSPFFILAAIILISFGPSSIECARILGIFPFPFKSHMVVFSTLMKELVRRGHEAVVVSTFPLTKPMQNYTDIDIMPEMKPQFETMVTEILYELNDIPTLATPLVPWDIGLENMELLFSSKQIQELLNDKRGFDLVISEAFMNEPVYGFAHHFKAPLVIVSPFGGFHWLNYGPANPVTPFFVNNAVTTFNSEIGFYERVINTIMTWLWDFGQEIYYKPRQEAIRKKVFGENAPSIWELERSVDLTLFNNHLTFNFPRPLVPSVVEVGGMHVMTKNNKLPIDIQKYLDEAKEGVIYFSMGSNLRSDLMPEERLQGFLDAFSQLPQRILMKWESDSLPGQPNNVKVGKWLPQQDILAHPNVQLFITHGGLLGMQEAIYHGVPLVGIPIFGDQAMNMRNAEQIGYGVKLELKNVTKDSVLWSVKKALEPQVRKEAKHRSLIFRDQPQSPLDRAVFWIEYVLRHKGAPHLRSAAKHLAWYQLYLLDIVVVIIFILSLSVIVIKIALKLVCTKKKVNVTKYENNSRLKKNA